MAAAAQQPAEELDGVAAHVECHAAAAATCVEKPAGVGPVVLFRLLDQMDFAERAFVDQLLEPHVLGREAKLLGITQHYAGPFAGGDHPVALGEVHRHRLFDDDVLAGFGGQACRLAVQVVGQAEHDQVDLAEVQEAR